MQTLCDDASATDQPCTICNNALSYHTIDSGANYKFIYNEWKPYTQTHKQHTWTFPISKIHTEIATRKKWAIQRSHT